MDFQTFMDPADHREMVSFRGSFSGFERSAFFVNDGAGRYIECAHGFGLDDDEDGRAVAPIDLDGDGDLDLAQLSLTSARVLLNQAPTRRFLRVRLHATKSEPLALGAQVLVEASGRRQLDRMRLTAGFHTQLLPELHFGLADAPTANIEVRWPSGATDRYAAVPADQVVSLTEGGTWTGAPIPAWPAASRPKARQVGLAVEVQDLDGAKTPVARPGAPVVVNFWAPWCAACVTEMPALSALAAELEDTAQFVGVSVERKDLAGVRAFVGKHGVRYPIRLATDAAIREFFGASAELALPATFVFDATGALRRAFYRPVSASDVKGALAGTTTAAEDHLVLLEGALARRDEPAVRAALAGAMAAAPDDPATLREVAQGFLRLGEQATGQTLLEDAIKRHPTVAELWAALASVRGAANDMAGAQTAVDRALALAPKSPVALNAAGMLRMGQGDPAGARRFFTAALAADPLFDLARRNLRRLSAPDRRR